MCWFGFDEFHEHFFPSQCTKWIVERTEIKLAKWYVFFAFDRAWIYCQNCSNEKSPLMSKFNIKLITFKIWQYILKIPGLNNFSHKLSNFRSTGRFSASDRNERVIFEHPFVENIRPHKSKVPHLESLTGRFKWKSGDLCEKLRGPEMFFSEIPIWIVFAQDDADLSESNSMAICHPTPLKNIINYSHLLRAVFRMVK